MMRWGGPRRSPPRAAALRRSARSSPTRSPDRTKPSHTSQDLPNRLPEDGTLIGIERARYAVLTAADGRGLVAFASGPRRPSAERYAVARMTQCSSASPSMRAGAQEACSASPDAGSAVKHRPADVVPQSLVVDYEVAYRPRQLVTLPLALESPCCLALAFWPCCTCGLDRIGGCTERPRPRTGSGRILDR
jgi:hypothetical protein